MEREDIQHLPAETMKYILNGGYYTTQYKEYPVMFEQYTAVQRGSRSWKIEYPSMQVVTELLRLGKAQKLEGGGYRYFSKDYKSVVRRFKANAVEPEGAATFADILCYTRTPWGNPQQVTAFPDEGKGLFFCSTARHGGLWLSDEWRKKLPQDYKSYIGNSRWAEEDCDCAEVLQIFGLLSLVSEPTELHITVDDIEKGRASRVDYYGRKIDDPDFRDGYAGGAMAEAWKRQTGCKHEIICTERSFQQFPAVWKYSQMSADAKAFMKACDAGEKVNLTTLLIQPYVYVPYRKRKQEKITLVETLHKTEDHSGYADSGDLFTLPTWRDTLTPQDVISALEDAADKLPFLLEELSFSKETAEHFLNESRGSYSEGDLPYTYSILTKGYIEYELGYQICGKG